MRQTKKVMLYVGPYLDRLENPYFPSLSQGLADAFERLGWDVIIFPYRTIYNQDLVLRLSRHRVSYSAVRRLHRGFFKKCIELKPDVVFLQKAEMFSPQWLAGIKLMNDPPLIVFYNSDDPQLFSDLGRFMGEVSDVVLTSSEMCVPMYRDIGIMYAQYMPFWAIPEILIPFKGEVPECFLSDIAFVGSYYPERGILLDSLVDALLDRNINLKVWGRGWEEAPKRVREAFWTGKNITKDTDLRYVFHGCKIALNMHHTWMKYGGMKANLRTYEALASGAFVLSDRSLGIEDLFKVGEQLVCYDSPDDLIAKVEYFLEHPAERQKIAARGYAAVKDRYTIDCWVQQADKLIMEALLCSREEGNNE